jgi:exodeoxyribonuclease V beta subunit
MLAVPLDPARKDFTLSRISHADRLNELEFYFPLKSISPRTLVDLFPKEIEFPMTADFSEQIERLDFAPLRGFMKGFIDMVFRFEDCYYLVDWKSNFLGGAVDDYNQEALAEAMKRDFYYLQYYIYTVAVNQYLKLRVGDYRYETHFGGVYYIFCRGIDPDRGPEFGVFRDRPPGAVIQKLSSGLIMEER